MNNRQPPSIDKGVARKLQVKQALLMGALKRDGWFDRTLTLDEAAAWDEDVSKAPSAVQGLMRRKHAQRATRVLVAGGVSGILRMPERLIAKHARDADYQTTITRSDAKQWANDRTFAPPWAQRMLDLNDADWKQRAQQREAVARIADVIPIRATELEIDKEWSATRAA